MSDAVDDLRAEITAIDVEILALVNRRLEVISSSSSWSSDSGIAFVDPERERRMFDERARENGGPLSESGLRSFYEELLALTKRELS